MAIGALRRLAGWKRPSRRPAGPVNTVSGIEKERSPRPGAERHTRRRRLDFRPAGTAYGNHCARNGLPCQTGLAPSYHAGVARFQAEYVAAAGILARHKLAERKIPLCPPRGPI